MQQGDQVRIGTEGVSAFTIVSVRRVRDDLRRWLVP